MWIELSLQESPTEHIAYENVSRITYTSKHLKIYFKDDRSMIKIVESKLEDVTWGKDRR